MKISRQELLQKVLCVGPAVCSQGGMRQSNCCVLQQGRVYALSHDMACSIASGLPKEWSAITLHAPLEKFLGLDGEDEADLELEETGLIFRKGRSCTKFAVENELLLPLHAVELPLRKDWQSVGDDFQEAVESAHQCAARPGKVPDVMRECVHLTPEYMESCDNRSLVRCRGEFSFKKSTLVRATALKELAKLGVTKAAETANWLHFRNPLGLRVSLRKIVLGQPYPNLDGLILKRGSVLKLPPELVLALQTAHLFIGDERTLEVKLSRDTFLLECASPRGSHREEVPTEYRGQETRFRAFAKVLLKLTEEHGVVEVTDSTLRVESDKSVFITSLKTKG